MTETSVSQKQQQRSERHSEKRECDEGPKDDRKQESKVHGAELAFRPTSSSETGMKENEDGHMWREITLANNFLRALGSKVICGDRCGLKRSNICNNRQE